MDEDKDINYKTLLEIIVNIEKAEAARENTRELDIDITKLLGKTNLIEVVNYNDVIEKLLKSNMIQNVNVGENQQSKELSKERVFSMQVSKDVKIASKDIGDLVSKIGKRNKASNKGISPIEQEAKQAKKSEVVIIGFSLQDQVSELEQISLGLDQNVFIPEQIGIVKDEVKALSEHMKKEKRPSDQIQAGIFDIRNQRLAEVKTKLGIK